jgi:multidrug efflux pump subunit AcrB
LPFANGVKSVETKNIQGLMIMKLTYYENTNMAQAAAELSSLSNRIQAAFPPEHSLRLSFVLMLLHCQLVNWY